MQVSLPNRTFGVLAIPTYRLLWLGLLGTSLAMNMQILARGLFVFSLTGSELALAWVMISFSLPQLVFSLWGGVLADRLAKRSIILAAQLINTLATGFMALLVLTERADFWDFIWLGFINGSMLSILMPARSAFGVEVVGTEQAVNAVSLNNAVWNLTRVLGPALAGVLIAVVSVGREGIEFGVGVVYCLITLLYALAAVSTLKIQDPGHNPHLKRKSAATSMFDDLKAGVSYLFAHRIIWGLVAFAVLPFVFAMPFQTLMPSMNERVLGGGPTDLGFLMTAIGIGAIAGSLLLSGNASLSRKGYWLIASGAFWGVLIVCFSRAESLAIAVAFATLVGGLNAFCLSLSRGMLQLQVDAEMRGRIMSIDMMLHGFAPIGILPLGLLAEVSGVPTALALSGTLLLLSFLALGWLLPEVRRIDER